MCRESGAEQGRCGEQVHTFRFNGHSPADPEHERGRKEEKVWARQAVDPIKIFEDYMISSGQVTLLTSS